ncbi:hypothetical protein VTL71DRAFT_2409 [Oculimacula yallundae]|uniref:AA9 family lytic polysaccharide monooxygenase n=1 Tax=Oculimacula yallundae TaxID=86028 RepID=A0ABR4CB21_9HELO
MKYSQVLVGAAVASLANAHATIHSLWVNGVDQGAGNSAAGYIRAPPNNSPVKDVTSKDMTCNVNNVAAAKSIDVKAGDKLSLEWHHDSKTAGDDIIDKTHLGPVMAYIAPAESNGAGDVWVKIAEDGFDGSKWGVERLIAAKGLQDVTLPASLAAGKYLLRGEVIALHEADTDFATNPGRGAQFYMECVQITVSGGTTPLPAGVAIPGVYTSKDPGVLFNLFGGKVTSYKAPGPAVMAAGAGAGTAPNAPAPVAGGSTPAPNTSTPTAPNATPGPVDSPATPAPKPTKSACSSKTPTTLATVTGSKPTPSPAPAAGTPAAGAPAAGAPGAAALYAQCGGQDFTGATTCEAGATCKDLNAFYSQCVPA